MFYLFFSTCNANTMNKSINLCFWRLYSSERVQLYSFSGRPRCDFLCAAQPFIMLPRQSARQKLHPDKKPFAIIMDDIDYSLRSLAVDTQYLPRWTTWGHGAVIISLQNTQKHTARGECSVVNTEHQCCGTRCYSYRAWDSHSWNPGCDNPSV